jgi:thioredoxin 1
MALMNVEFFYTVGCDKCANAREKLKATAHQTFPGITWREINVLEELDYAVELGVLTLPAIAIDRKLVFASLPTPAQLAQALQQHSNQESIDGH